MTKNIKKGKAERKNIKRKRRRQRKKKTNIKNKSFLQSRIIFNIIAHYITRTLLKRYKNSTAPLPCQKSNLGSIKFRIYLNQQQVFRLFTERKLSQG